jgi:hypothetical protein
MNGGYLSQAVRVATRIDSGFVVESMIFFFGRMCSSSSFVCSVCLPGGKQATANVAQIRLSLSVPREKVCVSSRVVKLREWLPGWCLVDRCLCPGSLQKSARPFAVRLCVSSIYHFPIPPS